jgi:endo-1,4-beta-xylanase
MKLLKTGSFWALLVCAGIFIMSMSCTDDPKDKDDTEVTVTFDANGGSPTPEPVTVKKGSSMGDQYPTEDPTKGDLRFDGWYNGAIKYDRDTKVSRNITLTAKWTDASSTTSVTFSILTANGSAMESTTALTLTFDIDITGLAAADITLTAENTGATMGALTPTGDGVYNLAVTGVIASGSVTVAVAKTGFTITPSSRTVSIFYRNPSAAVQVTAWKGLTVPSATKAMQTPTYQGKSDVLHVAPSGAEYAWSVLEYSLNAYANKKITITLSMDVWLPTSTKVAWQVNQTGYPVIAGSTQTSLSANQWHNVTGSAEVTVDGTGKVVYLSKDQIGATNVIYIANFVMTIDDGTGNGGATWEGKTAKMTIGARENLTGRITNFNPSGRDLTWSSNATNVATVNSNGVVTAVNFTTGGDSTVSSAATGTATITVTATGAAPNTDSFIINTTMASQVDMMTLTPMKDQFASHFMIGNIATQNDYGTGNNATITNQRLTCHYNVLTAENVMKPSNYGGSRNGGTVTGLTYGTPDAFVNAARSSGFKVHAHVLLWHQQNSGWINQIANETNKTTATNAMKSYINQVVTHYQGKIYSWDVLNEVFPDPPIGGYPTSDWREEMRKTGNEPNPWYKAIGSDFVYEGFLAARQADPDAILYYNDFNLDMPGKAALVSDMVRDVNQRYATANPGVSRKLIEGIGMQSHHNINITASAVKATLDLFRPLGVKISISEIDVLSQSWGDYSPNRKAPTNQQKLTAANLYGQFFKLFIDNADIIERVTFWGVYDAQSWRSTALPLPFDGNPTSRAKPAYYKIIGAL